MGKIREDSEGSCPLRWVLNDRWMFRRPRWEEQRDQHEQSPRKVWGVQRPLWVIHVNCAFQTEGLGREGRLEPEGLNPQASTTYSLFFQHQNHERFVSRRWHDDWQPFLLNKTRMHTYYILNQAKQIVWDGYFWLFLWETQLWCRIWRSVTWCWVHH